MSEVSKWDIPNFVIKLLSYDVINMLLLLVVWLIHSVFNIIFIIMTGLILAQKYEYKS